MSNIILGTISILIFPFLYILLTLLVLLPDHLYNYWKKYKSDKIELEKRKLENEILEQKLQNLIINSTENIK